jgi:hypothetical protein
MTPGIQFQICGLIVLLRPRQLKFTLKYFFFYVQEEIYDSIHSCISTSLSRVGEVYKFLIKDKRAFGPGHLEVNFYIYYLFLVYYILQF